MINLYVYLYLKFAHWIADFVLQTDKMAQNKSKDFKWLLIHTLTYSSVYFVALFPFFGFLFALKFAVITFIFHTLTDFITSRVNSKLWSEGKVHNFFVAVGFDQFLHDVQLILTFYFLIS